MLELELTEPVADWIAVALDDVEAEVPAAVLVLDDAVVLELPGTVPAPTAAKTPRAPTAASATPAVS